MDMGVNHSGISIRKPQRQRMTRVRRHTSSGSPMSPPVSAGADAAVYSAGCRHRFRAVKIGPAELEHPLPLSGTVQDRGDLLHGGQVGVEEDIAGSLFAAPRSTGPHPH